MDAAAPSVVAKKGADGLFAIPNPVD